MEKKSRPNIERREEYDDLGQITAASAEFAVAFS
jgi:hypothetical protein